MTSRTPSDLASAAPAKGAAKDTTASHPTRSRTTGSRIEGKQTFIRAIRAEWIKVRSLRSTWITSSIAVAITVLFGAGVAAASAQTTGWEAEAKHAITSGTAIGMIVVAVLGALIVTGEYSSGQIRSSLAAVPQRGRLLLAKAIVGAVLAFVLGAGSVLATWALSLPFMNGNAGSLADPEYAGYIWGTGLCYAGIALMAMGLGYIMRSTAGVITLTVVLLFVINIPLSLIAMKWDWANNVQGLLPQVASAAVTDPFALYYEWSQEGSMYFLEHWQAIAVFSAWAIVPLILGWIVFSRRDA